MKQSLPISPHILGWTHRGPYLPWYSSVTCQDEPRGTQRWSEDIKEEMSLQSHTPGFNSSLERLTGLAAKRQLAWLPFPRVFFCPIAWSSQWSSCNCNSNVANGGTLLCWTECWRNPILIHLLMSTLMKLWYPYFLLNMRDHLKLGNEKKKTRDSFVGKRLEIILYSYSNNNKTPHLSFMTLQ